FEERQDVARQRGDDLGTRRGQPRQLLFQRRALGVEQLLFARDSGLLRLLGGFSRLQLDGKRLGVLHVFQERVFVRAHVVLGDRHLLLHRLVFLVGLHFHQLSFVLGQPALDSRQL